MKKGIMVVVVLLYSFIGINMVFAVGDTWTQYNHEGMMKPIIPGHIRPISDKSKFAEVVLRSSMSMGYVWSYTLREEGIVQEVSHKNIGGDSCVEFGVFEQCTVGVSGKEIWTFKGLHEGETIAEFTLSHIHDSSLIVETIKILFTVNRRLEVKATYVTEVVLQNDMPLGYSWSYTLSKKDIVQEVSHTSRRGCSPCPEGFMCTMLCAPDGEEIITFKGLREGETTAEFTLANNSDSSIIAKTIIVVFKVTENLEIESTSIESMPYFND